MQAKSHMIQLAVENLVLIFRLIQTFVSKFAGFKKMNSKTQLIAKVILCYEFV